MKKKTTTKTKTRTKGKPEYLKFAILKDANHSHLRLDNTIKKTIVAEAARLGLTQATILNAYCAYGIAKAK